MDSQAFPYNEHIGYGDFDFYPRVHLEQYSVPEYALITEDLTLDAFYDVNELGAKNGELVLYIDSDVVTNEKAAEILLKTKELMDQSGISFYSVQLCLRYPPYDAEKSYERPEGEIDLRDFLYTDIYEEGMIERVAKCAEDTQNYYNEKNKEK